VEVSVNQIPITGDMAVVRALGVTAPADATLLGDGRALMRHGSGAIHAALLDATGDTLRLGLYGTRNRGGDWACLVDKLSSDDSRGDGSPATDSNQNGVYVAFTQDTGSGRAGYVAHVPDPFGDPGHFTLHGPLTPPDIDAEGSFLQASRVYNSVVYNWHDARSGDVYVGVARDGIDFPAAQQVVTGQGMVNAAATGIRGDYVNLVYRTRDTAFGSPEANGGYHFAWRESGDGGQTWTDARPLVTDAQNLPEVVSYALTGDEDLKRSQTRLTGESLEKASLQVLVWMSPNTRQTDSRVFAMTSVQPKQLPSADWRPSDGSIGLLAFKPIAVGGEWEFTLANRTLYRRGSAGKPHAGREGTMYKYGALPDTAVRSIVYVEHAPEGSGLEDQVVSLVSTNMGDTFDYETVFSASQLSLSPGARILISNSACCFTDAEGNIWQDLLIADERQPQVLRHAMLPIGFNIQGTDPTRSW
jgi:hypothetical protein